jgi:hypothetical protein
MAALGAERGEGLATPENIEFQEELLLLPGCEHAECSRRTLGRSPLNEAVCGLKAHHIGTLAGHLPLGKPRELFDTIANGERKGEFFIDQSGPCEPLGIRFELMVEDLLAPSWLGILKAEAVG